MITYAELLALEKTDQTFATINRLQYGNDTRFRRLDYCTFALRYHADDIVLIHSTGNYTIIPHSGSGAILRRIERSIGHKVSHAGRFGFQFGSLYFKQSIVIKPNGMVLSVA